MDGLGEAARGALTGAGALTGSAFLTGATVLVGTNGLARTTGLAGGAGAGLGGAMALVGVGATVLPGIGGVTTGETFCVLAVEIGPGLAGTVRAIWGRSPGFGGVAARGRTRTPRRGVPTFWGVGLTGGTDGAGWADWERAGPRLTDGGGTGSGDVGAVGAGATILDCFVTALTEAGPGTGLGAIRVFFWVSLPAGGLAVFAGCLGDAADFRFVISDRVRGRAA